MRKKLLLLIGCLSLSLFHVNAENSFVRVNSGTSQPMGMSSDGRYVVGIHAEMPFQSYLWDTQTTQLDWKTQESTDYEKTGYFTAVNNSGTIVGAFKDANYIIDVEDVDEYWRPITITGPITVAAIWKDGICTSLGIGGALDTSKFLSFDDGSRATCISEDGNIVGGNLYINQTAKQIPCVWRYVDGEWKFEEYKYPADAYRTIITDMSADGSIIVGYADYQTYTVPLMWKGANNMTTITPVFPVEGVQYSGICYSISPNGQFIGLTLGIANSIEPAMVYDLEMNWMTQVQDFGDYPVRVEIASICNNGTMVGTYHYIGGVKRNFFYSEEYSGGVTYDLEYFYYILADGLEVPSAALTGNLIGASANGENIVGYTSSFSWMSHVDYPSSPTYPPMTPGNISARVTNIQEVEVTWDEPSSLGYTLKNYHLYRNGQKYKTIEYEAGKDIITFVDTQVPVGTVQYAVSVEGESMFDNGKLVESPKTNSVKFAVAPNMNLPFLDGFDGGNPESNYWTKNIERAGTYEYLWGYAWTIGTINNSNVLNIAIDGFSDYSQSLTTKHLDARQLDEVYVSYAIKANLANVPEEGWDLSADTLSVEVSTDGTSWVPVRRHSIDEEPYFWDTQIHDISEWVAGEIFQVRLRVHGKNKAQMVWNLDMFRVGAKDETRKAPLEGKAIVRENSVDLLWTNELDSYELTYLDNVYGYAMTRAIGGTNGNIIYVNMVDNNELKPYHGSYYITSINAYIHGDEETIQKLTLVVYEDDKLIREQEITNYLPLEMNLFVLDEPVLIDANKTIKYGFNMTHFAGEAPVFYQNTFSYVRGKSDLYSEDGGETWVKLSEFFENNPSLWNPDMGIDEVTGYACWFMSANVTEQNKTDYTGREINIIAYEVYRDGERVNKELLSYLQPKFTDDEVIEDATYEVVIFYNDGSFCEFTELPYVTDPVNSIERALNSKESLFIYPNPARDVVYVNGGFDKAVIVNVSGQVVVETTQNPIRVESLENGVYFINVKNAEGNFTRKLIIKK